MCFPHRPPPPPGTDFLLKVTFFLLLFPYREEMQPFPAERLFHCKKEEKWAYRKKKQPTFRFFPLRLFRKCRNFALWLKGSLWELLNKNVNSKKKKIMNILVQRIKKKSIIQFQFFLFVLIINLTSNSAIYGAFKKVHQGWIILNFASPTAVRAHIKQQMWLREGGGKTSFFQRLVENLLQKCNSSR